MARQLHVNVQTNVVLSLPGQPTQRKQCDMKCVVMRVMCQNVCELYHRFMFCQVHVCVDKTEYCPNLHIHIRYSTANARKPACNDND